jgi:tripartite-type tricarboxylate transporter receptor subunit TctC
VTLIVPFPAGGPVDVIGRLLAERMRQSLGQAVVVENVSGASGSIAVGRVARATADGYTIILGNWGTFVANGAFMPLQYDLLSDFAPIAQITTQPYMIVARKSLPANDVQELVAWLKANPDKASQGTSGIGTPAHVAGLFFQKVTGTRFQSIPYRGLAPAMQDLLAGQTDLMFDSPVSSLPQVRAGHIKAFAVMAKTRAAAAPEVPTVDEAGLPGVYMGSWYGMWAPRGTAKDVIAKLTAAAREALADNNVRGRIAHLGQEIPPVEQQTPEFLGTFQRAEIETWWPIIKAAGIKAN